MAVMVVSVFLPALCLAADVKGKVIDGQTGEPLIGATVMVDGSANGNTGVVTDIDGNFQLSGVKKGKCVLTIKYIGYKPVSVEALASDTGSSEPLLVKMETDSQVLGEVKVTAMAQHNTEAAMVEAAKVSQVIVSNISAQEIRKTQDNNAGEVIRRVPGVSLIEEKFVMVRGLSQRYNNVWINGGAVPSSEADSRAFSFDIIP